ncbi:hypothetical protein [Tropicimonas sp. IMCC6043]|uniref:hypothetical protein n=1 Tax=Tropicimonas sp. IMCC6043 TaxID=2510645 RepID=UPI00101B5F30|nr:hypothetical protein [Tropicimonas sp. IMCC6043]RYH06927.1 hypothetical protein EU800_22120 [Tropicimonas sp. IMCC6043]
MTRLKFTALAAMATLTLAVQMPPAAAQDADPQVTLFSGVNVFDGENKPRFVPVSLEAWNAEFSTGMPSDFTGAFPADGGN